MAINAVELSADAYMVCLAHTFSTEKEEIMGLLIGEVSFGLEAVCVLFTYIRSILDQL